MPENIRALIITLALYALAFALARVPMATLVGKERTRGWMMVWISVTAALFLTQNFWIFLLAAGFILLLARGLERDRIVLYMLVLCAAPVVKIVIPGFGGIVSFAHISPQDFFAAILLIPAWLIQRNARSDTVQARWPFLFLATYSFLILALHLRESSVTDTTREAFNLFFAVVLPFLTLSTYVNSTDRMKDTATAFIFPLLPLALVGVLEYTKSWHLYSSAVASWTNWEFFFSYLQRDGALRAYGSTGMPIVFGFLFMTGIGLCLGLPPRLLPRKQRIILIAILMLGLLSPLSRGPWVGALAILIIFLLIGRSPFRNLMKLAAVGFSMLVVLTLLPGGEKLLRLLPFVENDVDAETIDYRFQLLENSKTVIMRNPVFGSVDYLQTPEMQELIQGQGIIDVVNTYLGIALQYGIVGVGLFMLFFISILFGLARAVMSLPDAEVELKLTGRALIATLCGVLVTIFTVSSVGQIPHIYWILAGLCVAQTRIIKTHIEASRSTATPAPIPAHSAGMTPVIRKQLRVISQLSAAQRRFRRD